MYRTITATLLVLSFSATCLASGAPVGTPAGASLPRESGAENGPRKPHQPTSVNAPRQQ